MKKQCRFCKSYDPHNLKMGDQQGMNKSAWCKKHKGIVPFNSQCNDFKRN